MSWGILGFVARTLNPIALAKAFVFGLIALVRKAPLAWSLAVRDVNSRHRAQFLGPIWSIAHPVLLMLIFLFLFGVVFKMRIDNTFEMPRDYTVYILSGLVPWLAISPSLTQTTQSVVGSAHLVKQFHFDTIVLPLRDIFTTFYFWGVGLTFVTAYSALSGNGIPWTYALLPPVLLVTFLLVVGLGWFFAAATVFFRDLKEVMVVVLTLFLYLLPIVYLPEWIPALFRGLIVVNPFSYVIWVYQDVLYFGRIEHPEAWWIASAFSIFAFAAGYRVFVRFRPYFGNSL